MTNDIVYLLDTSVFIEANQRWYPFDIAPGFWEALLRYAKEGRLASIDRVRDELIRGNDQLSTWAKHHCEGLFLLTCTADVIECYRDVMQWIAVQTQYLERAKQQFADQADGWLVAYAKVMGWTIVTDEQFNANSRARIPLPNVCVPFRVPYINTINMLRSLGVRFHLE